MKILLYHWKAYGNRFLCKQLQLLGHEVKEWSNSAVMLDEDNSLEAVQKELKKGYDLVFSYNYFRILALACHEAGTPYFAWTQDSPMLSLYDKTTYLETNYFFCFDYEQYEGLKIRGIEKAFYCPLAVDTETLEKVSGNCTSGEIRRFGADISFVGSLYSERNMLSSMDGLPDYVKGYFGAVVEAQLHLPSLRFSNAQIPADEMNRIRNYLNFSGTEESKVRYEELVENLIDRDVTVRERSEMMKILSNWKGFKLFTGSDTSLYPDISNCGTVDYYTEMPKVFQNSKINLNTTLRSIRSGIPLRILDVIASGGFLLTDAQPELFWFFEDGESLATFQNFEEMEEKIAFYLQHETEREKIIRNGRQIVKAKFDYKVRLPEMFKLAGI
ncbi:MAG: glycosyltransferase [Lachnospiraceae bacterium]|nr:glycosyltransferase [Lachnospiraceae bacterium]